MLTSIIIRTYNEEKYLEQLLNAIQLQKCELTDLEVVIVDSGSDDQTLEIAKRHGSRITHIAKSEFTFGRSLNIGCEFARGNIFAFVSGHCIPVDSNWLDELVRPILDKSASYTYGKQEGFGPTKFSEKCHFDKWFPNYSKIPQLDYFCNNANAALDRSTWEEFHFNEDLTGLEDMYLAKQLATNGKSIAYIAKASVHHIHDEGWRQVMLRYEREAIALQEIMPEVHLSVFDFLRFFFAGVFSDLSMSIKEKCFLKYFFQIFIFRFTQYLGSYRGNHEHRKLSQERKNHYFYPKVIKGSRVE